MYLQYFELESISLDQGLLAVSLMSTLHLLPNAADIFVEVMKAGEEGKRHRVSPKKVLHLSEHF